MKHHLVIAGLACFMMCSLSSAAADEKEEARRHFDAGIKLLEKQDFNGAAAELSRSVESFANKNNIYNLANAYVALHRYGEALRLFERLLNELDSSLDEAMRKDAKKQIEELTSLVAALRIVVAEDGATISVDKERVGASPLKTPLVLGPGHHSVEVVFPNQATVTQEVDLVAGGEKQLDIKPPKPRTALTIISNVQDATVTVNGAMAGRTPLADPLSLDPGTYRVTVSKEGRQPVEKEVTLAAEETKTLLFDLPDAALTQNASSEPTARAKRSPLLWVGVSGTAVFGVVSAALWGVGAAKLGDYNGKADYISENLDDWDVTNPDDEQAEQDARSDAIDLKKQAENLNTAAVIMTAATGAFAVLTVVGALLPKWRKESPDGAVISVRPGGLEVRF